MHKVIFTVVVCSLVGSLQAQDTIYRVDGSKQVVKIIEINPTQVKYKPAGKPEGPVIVLGKHQVTKLAFENGTSESYQILAPLVASTEIDNFGIYKRNFVTINNIDILKGTLSMGYERLFPSGYFSLTIPVSIPLVKKKYFKGSDGSEGVSTGVTFNYYPGGPEKLKYFMSISYSYSRYQYTDWDSFTITYATKKAYSNGMAFQTGILYHFSKNLAGSVQIGIGWCKFSQRDDYYRSSFVPVAVNIGYKF